LKDRLELGIVPIPVDLISDKDISIKGTSFTVQFGIIIKLTEKNPFKADIVQIQLLGELSRLLELKLQLTPTIGKISIELD